MPRQELSNVFQDGLMMDLNPINTPKSVLTDCLNGTYITYNGNEFVLQNDMGNYKLKNCKLPTNFIPVGVKGYGDILYIVSYNPITNETEIGSYPAPQSIFTTGDSEELLAQEDDLAPFTWGEGSSSKEVEYPTIIRTNKKPIFIFTGTDEETYKLNPGDEFKFSGELTSPIFIYQHLNFYVIDEDNKLYDIDDTQIYNENGSLVSSNTMRKVFWETPGWLAAQYDLYVPDKFNLNLRSLNVPEFLTAKSDETSSQAEGEPLDKLEPGPNQFKVSMDLSSQTIITDRLFQTELDKNFGHDNPELNLPWSPNPANVYDHLYIRYLIKQNQNPPEKGEDDYGTFKGIVVSIDDTHTKDYTNGITEGDYIYYDIPVWKHNYQDDIITAYNNIRPIWFCNNPEEKKDGSKDLDIANYHGVVELTAYPIIKYNGLTLKYTQFSTTQRFPLNTLKNSSDITIADSIYKWSVDDDSCTISFNINGPFINASDITGRYEVYRINLFNYAKSETNAKSQAAEGTNENPKSISYYNIEKGLIGDFLVEENKKWIRKSDQLINVYSFTSEEKLLLCEGRLSNLVLYGQNTLNIDWNSSKEYILNNYCNYYTNPDYNFTEGADNGDLEKVVKDTSFVGYNEENPQKTINFSKEGGIYIFRVILEQNGSQLAESQQVLIPSEVFNEWFGSIDNYNSITGTQWVQNWWNYQNISSLIINNLDIDFEKYQDRKAGLLDGWFLYKWNSDSYDYRPLTREQLINDKLLTTDSDKNLTFIQLLEIVFNAKFPKNTEIHNIGTSNQTFKWIASDSFIQDIFLFQIDYNKFEKTITSSLSLNNTSLNGNLWNLKQKININLKQNSNKLGISINCSKENNIIEFNNKFSNLISSIDNKKFGTGYTEWIYPFIKSIETTSGISIQSQDYNDERHTPINIDRRPGTRAIAHHNYFKLRQTVDDPNNNMANDFYNNLNNSQLLYYPVYLDAAHGGYYWGIYHKIYIGYGSDINGSGYKDLATYASGPEWKPMFVIKSLNSNNPRFTIVHVGEKMEDLKTFFTVLCGMRFRNKTPEQKEYHFPVWSLQQNIPTEAVYTSNKFDVVNKLNYLFADDWYLIQNKNIDINNITSFLLTFTNSIPKEKTQYNLSLSSSININLNYKDNAEYNTNIQSLNTIITDSYYTNWIASLENDTTIDFVSDVEILKSDIGSDSITFFDGMTESDISIDTIANTNYSLTDAQKEHFITLFGTTKNGENYSEKTICFNNSKEFELRGARCHESYGGGLRNDCGVISIAYYQKQDAINITI